MTISSLKDLQKLIALCRKTGVDAIEVDNIKMNLGPDPIKKTRNMKEYKEKYFPSTTITHDGVNENTKIDIPDVVETPDELTDEQLMFYSAGSGQAEQ